MSSNQDVAVDPVTIVIKECITLSTAMRKYTKYTSQSGVAALLSGGSEIFSNQDESLASTFNNLSANKHNDPLLSGFVQLRLMLNNSKSLDEIDSLTLLQPFLLVISTGTISGYITSLALDSLQKFFTFNIINDSSLNHIVAYREAVNSLTHCRFEGSEQTSDDSVLLKVLVLLEMMILSPYSDVLSDSIMYEVLQTVMSLACNKKRTEILRKAAEMSMMSITVKLFGNLRKIPPTEAQKYINDEDFSRNTLKDDIIGTSTDMNENQAPDDIPSEAESLDSDPQDTQKVKVEQLEENYGLPVTKDYLTILVSLIVPENQFKHNNSTKVFGLNLLNMALELSGDVFPQHPRLFNLVSDPIFKNVLYLIQNTDRLSILQSAVQLFTTMTIVLGEHLQRQVELTLQSIFEVLLKNQSDNIKPRSPAMKELLIEQISILWTRSPYFFTFIFKNYDCNLNRPDLSSYILKSLAKLALPESAAITADSVPPICLEGLISLIDSMHDRIKGEDKAILQTSAKLDVLEERARKTEFIKCAEAFNSKPKKGIPLLIENGFIKSDSEDDIAKFLFEKNGRLNKKTIGEYLATPDNITLLKKFIGLFDFKDLRIDEAIRILLTKFRLPGESQQIERIVESFSAIYVESQEYDLEKSNQDIENDYSTVQPDADSVFILSFSIIMLNTDLHNPVVKKHMTFDDYTYNLKGCNNQKDFPMWYLDRIYCSIRDKEIVMPEEHHGSETWFDDVWNNLVSSNTVITQTSKEGVHSDDLMDSMSLIKFEKAIFENVGPSIIETLFRIFEIASDDHISTRMLTSIDKCAQLSAFFSFNDLFNVIMERITKLTTLAGEIDASLANDYETEDIPVVEINVEETQEKITVSNLSVRLGKNFKGQLCTVILFRFLQKNEDPHVINETVWSQIFRLLLNLFENGMISPDIFPDLQKTLKLGSLPRPAPEYSINKSKVNRGLLSTFASYLKGDEEPTEEEFKASLNALECIRTSHVASSIFGNERNVTGNLVNTLLECLSLEKTEENSRFYESEILFIMELCVASFLFCKDDKDVGKAVLTKLISLSHLQGTSKLFVRRVLAYKMLLVSILEERAALLELVNEDLLAKEDIYNQHFFCSDQGAEFLKTLLSLTEIENYSDVLLQDEGFWKTLRVFASNNKHTLTVFQYIEGSVLKKTNVITQRNFMWLLGLLDEISSIGAVGGQWEEEYDKLIKSGRKTDKENPYEETVELSLKSINSTAHLFDIKRHEPLSKSEMIALIQALAHQCMNPCQQLRTYALSSLEDTLNKHLETFSHSVSLAELIEGGLLTMINSDNNQISESSSIVDVLLLLKKVYLHYLALGEADNDTFLKVLGVFNKYVDNSEVEKILQDLITEKKDIEKQGSSQDQPPQVLEPVIKQEVVPPASESVE